MISRFQINGLRRLFFLDSSYRFSTVAAPPLQPPPNDFLANYLINSLGLSENEALSATKKDDGIKKGDSSLFCYSLGSYHWNPPSVFFFHFVMSIIWRQEHYAIGDISLVTWTCSREYAGELPSSLLPLQLNDFQVADQWLSSAFRLQFSLPNVHDGGFFAATEEPFLVSRLPDQHIRVVQRRSSILHEEAASTISKKTIDMKIGVLRSFGFSDLTVYRMIKKFPTLVRTSEDKMRRVWNFFVKEIGCDPDFLASYPNVFNFSLEKKVIPRYEIMKTLKEKNLTKRKPGLYKLLNISETNFVNHFVLPYKDEIPDMVDSYLAAVGRKKT